MSSGAEFYENFMKNYFFWGDKQKTLTTLKEISKFSVLGLIATFCLSPKSLFISAVWIAILTRSKFIQIFMSVVKQTFDDFYIRRFKRKFHFPGEPLLKLLRKEKNICA